LTANARESAGRARRSRSNRSRRLPLAMLPSRLPVWGPLHVLVHSSVAAGRAVRLVRRRSGLSRLVPRAGQRRADATGHATGGLGHRLSPRRPFADRRRTLRSGAPAPRPVAGLLSPAGAGRARTAGRPGRRGGPPGGADRSGQTGGRRARRLAATAPGGVDPAQ